MEGFTGELEDVLREIMSTPAGRGNVAQFLVGAALSVLGDRATGLPAAPPGREVPGEEWTFP